MSNSVLEDDEALADTAASSKPLPDLPPPVPPKPTAAKPLPPLPSPDAFSDDDDSDDDAPLLPRQQVESRSAARIVRRSPIPLSIYILYTLILFCALPTLALLLWGYTLSKGAPFDEQRQKLQLNSYTEMGLLQVMVLSGVDIVWSLFVLYSSKKGLYGSLLFLTVIIDFAQWALLIAFGLYVLFTRLWDRSLCDADGYREGEDLHEICQAASLKLLNVELLALGLAFLLATSHLVLLVVRCCSNTHITWRQSSQTQHERWELVERRSEDGQRAVPKPVVIDPNRLAPPGHRYGSKRTTSKLSVPFVASNREGTIRL